MSPKRPRRKTLFRLVILFILFWVVDTALYVFLGAVQEKRNLFYDKSGSLSKDLVDAWLQHTFDPDLGWDIPTPEKTDLGNRRTTDATEYPKKDRYKVKLFGDSFTWGAEVELNETINAYMEAATDWNCLNYGVGAYGPDQAFLKYRKNKIPSDYVIFGIQQENIGRLVSRYAAYYMREWAPPKPRFVVRDGRIELLDNPIRSKDDANKLFDAGFVQSLRADDYWPNYYETVQGAPARRQWPATWTLVRHLPFFWRRVKIEVDRRFSPSYEAELQTYKYYHLYDPSSEGMKIMTHVVDGFAALARERGERVIVMVFPDQFTLDVMKKYAKTPYAPLIEHLQARNYDFVDFGPVFLGQDYVPLFVGYNRHFSPAGNKLVAERMIQLVRDIDARDGKR